MDAFKPWVQKMIRNRFVFIQNDQLHQVNHNFTIPRTPTNCLQLTFRWHNAAWWRIRVGSTFANSGGTVHQIDRLVLHASYDGRDNDVAVLRTATNIIYIANTVAPATIASANYNLGDNQAVWAIGWGAIRVSLQFTYHQVFKHMQSFLALFNIFCTALPGSIPLETTWKTVNLPI